MIPEHFDTGAFRVPKQVTPALFQPMVRHVGPSKAANCPERWTLLGPKVGQQCIKNLCYQIVLDNSVCTTNEMSLFSEMHLF